MRVAVLHDWLTGMRGGENVLEAILELFPAAEIFTLLHVKGSVSREISRRKIHTSFLQKMPAVEKRYRHYLPLMPLAASSLDLSGFDLVVSSSHAVIKGAPKPEGAVHVSYIHAPMRYMWERFDDYFGPGKASPPVRLAASALRGRMQEWDRRVSQDDRIDHLIANSAFIAGQIERAYGRKAEVIHPFVNLERFRLPDHDPTVGRRNYLMVGAFAPNKRVDLAIETFNRLKLPLIIVGGGQDERKLKKLGGPTIDFLGSLSNSAIVDLYGKAKAFIFPGIEDFGITPLEAMASGTPVVAYAYGGALETVTDRTGVFFNEQTVDALCEAVMKVERNDFDVDRHACRTRAEEFSRLRFQQKLAEAVRRTWASAGKDPAVLGSVLKAPES